MLTEKEIDAEIISDVRKAIQQSQKRGIYFLSFNTENNEKEKIKITLTENDFQVLRKIKDSLSINEIKKIW